MNYNDVVIIENYDGRGDFQCIFIILESYEVVNLP